MGGFACVAAPLSRSGSPHRLLWRQRQASLHQPKSAVPLGSLLRHAVEPGRHIARSCGVSTWPLLLSLPLFVSHKTPVGFLSESMMMVGREVWVLILWVPSRSCPLAAGAAKRSSFSGCHKATRMLASNCSRMAWI